MLKACFDCGHDTIITDVIHSPIFRFLSLTIMEKTVEYTCRMCGTKYYVIAGHDARVGIV
jgi:hypothetical protein